jgi:ABC-2 type transport system ATP-binding protein
MRAVEAIRSAADLYADPYPVDELVERLRLGDVGRRPFRRLSGGEQQRVGLAVALVGRPHLLLLDEPTSGMDPATRKETWDLLTELAVAGTTVVVTTHQIDEAEAVADHVVLIAAGRTVAEGRPHALSGDAPTVRFEAAPGLPIATLTAGVAREDSPGRYVVVGARGRADADLMAAVLAWCGTNSVVPSQLTAGRPSLESAVLDLVDWTATR